MKECWRGRISYFLDLIFPHRCAGGCTRISYFFGTNSDPTFAAADAELPLSCDTLNGACTIKLGWQALALFFPCFGPRGNDLPLPIRLPVEWSKDCSGCCLQEAMKTGVVLAGPGAYQLLPSMRARSYEGA